MTIDVGLGAGGKAQHQMNFAETALGMVTTAHSHDAKMQQMTKNVPGESDV
jgi:hypothetical protein